MLLWFSCVVQILTYSKNLGTLDPFPLRAIQYKPGEHMRVAVAQDF